MFTTGNNNLQIYELLCLTPKAILRASYVITTLNKHVDACISFWSQVQQIFFFVLSSKKGRRLI